MEPWGGRMSIKKRIHQNQSRTDHVHSFLSSWGGMMSSQDGKSTGTGFFHNPNADESSEREHEIFRRQAKAKRQRRRRATHSTSTERGREEEREVFWWASSLGGRQLGPRTALASPRASSPPSHRRERRQKKGPRSRPSAHTPGTGTGRAWRVLRARVAR